MAFQPSYCVRPSDTGIINRKKLDIADQCLQIGVHRNRKPESRTRESLCVPETPYAYDTHYGIINLRTLSKLTGVLLRMFFVYPG